MSQTKALKEIHAPTGHQKWETQACCVGHDNESVDKKVAEMGNLGWEPWALLHGPNGHDIHFKRPKIQEA